MGVSVFIGEHHGDGGLRIVEVARAAHGFEIHERHKTLFEVPGYRVQALVTNLPPSIDALGVWRRYNGRADMENRIKELGAQFGIRGLCCRAFWATELRPGATARGAGYSSRGCSCRA